MATARAIRVVALVVLIAVAVDVEGDHECRPAGSGVRAARAAYRPGRPALIVDVIAREQRRVGVARRRVVDIDAVVLRHVDGVALIGADELPRRTPPCGCPRR